MLRQKKVHPCETEDNYSLQKVERSLVGPTECRRPKAFVAWMRERVIPTLDFAVGVKLKLLLDRFEMYAEEQHVLTKRAREPRYKVACAELRQMPGVGLVSGHDVFDRDGRSEPF